MSDAAMPTTTLSVRVCLGLGRLFSKGPLGRFGVRNTALMQSADSYIGKRVSSIEDYRRLFAPFCRFAGRTVMELGCNRGYMLAGFLEVEPFRAVGVDISEEALAIGRATHGDRIEFVKSTPTSIPLPEGGVDVIYTVDTVEHLSRPYETFQEAFRVLRPGGVFLVHFHPWLGPYGAHLGDALPIPWPHVFFSMDTLLAAAAVRYESADYQAPWYRFDSVTKERRPNPYREDWSDYLNRMTIRGFKRMLRRLPFEVLHVQGIGFGGRTVPVSRWFRGLARVPVLDEFFSSALYCVLRKPSPEERPRS